MNSGRGSEPLDQGLGGGSENVVVGDLPALLGLDPLGPKAMLSAPFLEHGTQPDDMQKRSLPDHSADRGAVIGVEVPMHGDATRLGELDRLSYLPALKVLFVHPRRWVDRRTARTAAGRALAQAGNHRRRSARTRRERAPRQARRRA